MRVPLADFAKRQTPHLRQNLACGVFVCAKKELFSPCTPDYALLARLFSQRQSSTKKNPAHEISSRVQGCFLTTVRVGF
jgi:hypothetical protein